MTKVNCRLVWTSWDKSLCSVQTAYTAFLKTLKGENSHQDSAT